MFLLFAPVLLAIVLTFLAGREALFPPEMARRNEVVAGRTGVALLGVSELLALAMFTGRAVPNHNPAPLIGAIGATALGGLLAALLSFPRVQWLAGAAAGVMGAWIAIMLVVLSALSGLR